MTPARLLAVAPLVLALLAVSGCSSTWGCSDTTAKRGKAAVRVRVEDIYGQHLGASAEIVDWRLEPHPQRPSDGDQVHFHFRFYDADEFNGPALDVCAVDKKRVALLCETVYSAEAFGPNGDPTGDSWLAVEHPAQVAGVLFIPNDQHYQTRTCAQDGKDGGGPHPPEPATLGDQL
ncbi:hypothetical protein [Streptomyces sp. MBT62]|uniref:hypothetical protein n=1 Tax=Streptomyces sp. MBT62 TaxID=2800410 RepID=UPI00190DE38C|nr:hypothetical protein [Streptomyces sp. MBT62]MBK3568098.1 hypothetical protein [Streptomyces sp. MBT62]